MVPKLLAKRACRRLRPSQVLCILSFLACANGTAFAATYHIDATAGDDANAGTDRSTAWQSWGKLLDGIDAGTVGAGDTVLVRPGRYRAHAGPTSFPLPWKVEGNAAATIGGAPGAPLTISVDIFYPGDVEITAALPGGYSSAARQWTTPWAPAALDCTDAGIPWSCCAGVSIGCPSIYRTDVDMVGRSKGVGPGACFQPGSEPGRDPVMWESLYSGEGTPVDLPAFTAGRDQCWFYIETESDCLAAGDPWRCCEGPATGSTCTENARVYARTSADASPAMLATPPEFPAGAILELGDIGEVTHVRLTNAANGRRFHLRWGTSALLRFKAAHHINIEDFELGYNSRIRSNKTLAFGAAARSGSGFPRNTQGSSYLVFVTENATTPQHHFSFKRGIVEKGQGDEAFHIGSPVPQIGQTPATCASVVDCTETALGNPVLCADLADCNQGGRACCYYVPEDDFGLNVYEDLEIRDIPWQIANGADFYGNGAYTWPPSPYSPTWDVPYGSHFSPLGGGGQTPGGLKCEP
ncbi:MAG: hypothetical protein E4H03_06475 [Myxococcales bacterium]|nr:MAG: hypothetical protein E4H03_06475 [Myxococcales bacterium]